MDSPDSAKITDSPDEVALPVVVDLPSTRYEGQDVVSSEQIPSKMHGMDLRTCDGAQDMPGAIRHAMYYRTRPRSHARGHAKGRST